MKYIKLALLTLVFVPFAVNADSVRLLEDPNEAWEARINIIEQAQDTIEVEYYIYPVSPHSKQG